MKWKKPDFDRLVPPGFDYGQELRLLGGGIAGSVFFSLFWFSALRDAWKELYSWHLGVKTLIPGTVMRDFWEMVLPYMAGFALVALWELTFVLRHYHYHHEISKSIYLMRRLPNRWERHRRCWTLPLLCCAAVLLAGLVMLLIYYIVYLSFTPPDHLAQKYLWR